MNLELLEVMEKNLEDLSTQYADAPPPWLLDMHLLMKEVKRLRFENENLHITVATLKDTLKLYMK